MATLGVMAGLADILAPLLGGLITTFFSWRYTFAFELIFILFILAMQNKIPDFKPTESKSDLDIIGAILSGRGYRQRNFILIVVVLHVRTQTDEQ